MKIKFLYYKHLLDIAFLRFFDEFNNSFKRDGDCYVFSDDFSRQKLKKFFKSSIENEIASLAPKWSLQDPSCLVIVGSCIPRDNILLSFKDKKTCYFPDKLERMLEDQPTVKWILSEDGIQLDLLEFNRMLCELFDELFAKSSKHLGSLKNVMFISHKKLDCYATFKILKWIYGKTASVNLYEETKLNEKKLPLIAVNDMLSRYIHNKVAMNKSVEFKQCADELKQYANGWLAELLS